MTPASAFLPLVSALPLLAVPGRRPGVIGATAAAAAALAAVSLFHAAPALQAAAQLPALIAAAVAAWLFAGSLGAAPDASAESPQLLLRRNELKSSVAEAERQETRALQIYGTAKSLGGSLSWEEMGPRLASAVQRLFGSFDFLLYAQDGGRLSLLQRRGTWKREPPVERVPTEAGVLRPPAAAEVSPVLVVPIQSAEKGAAGALFVKVAVDPAREREFVEIAAELGPQLAMALAKALLFRQLETQSRTDGLTGVLRRQAFTDRMDEEFKRSAVFNTNFSVLMIDIDHFKSVNDQHGHPAGDAVLARIGKVLMESFYETDVVGRYGGEEFIVLLPRSEFDGVMRKAEALRRRIESERIQTGFGPLQVTVSIGAARFPEAGRTPDDLIASADRALYRAKEGGRNRVEGA
jgi:diguanylate cyclase (GGDEF)-like protein